ncbi:MAG: lipopolysaccharide biosynthesis protein [Burkholderiaceae bacterium]|nr:lipopolysaccharide biosynthesis protein [Burkholderiaceae bacterium]
MTARRNFYLAAGESYLGVVIGLLSTIVLARLLTPAEIGTFSVAASFTGLAHALRELGVGNYLVQEKELTDERIRAAFTVSLLAAWPAGAALLVASPWVARFYRNPELTPILVVLAANFFLLPFGSVTLAYLRRSMLFGRGLIINVSGSAVRVAASIALALAGMGALSLALGASAGLLTTVILATILRPKRLPWLPGFRELRRVLKFGLTVTGGSLAGSANEAAPDLIIGKVLGAADTGMFNKALGLATMINNLIMQPLWKFMMPYFSQKSRSGENVAPIYLRIVSVVTGFTWPVLLTAAIAADPIVQLLLGSQWLDAIPVARILCIAVIIGAAFSPLSSFLIARSRVDLYLRAAMLAFLFRAGFLLATVWFGLQVVAWGFVGGALANSCYAAYLLRRYMSIGVRDLLQSWKRSALLSAIVGPVALGGIGLSLELELVPILSLMMVFTVSATTWLAAVSKVHPDAAVEVFQVMRKMSESIRIGRFRSGD